MMPDDATSQKDFEIVRRVIDGDVNAFESLLVKFKDPVFNMVSKHIPHGQVEEVAHDVFIRAYQSLPSFKYKSSFKQWLFAIAIRSCYDFWRREYRSRELPISSLTENDQRWLEEAVADQSSQANYEENARKEARELLDWALNRLSAEDRMVLELVYLDGCSVKEAADFLGWSIANVKVRSFRSRKKLRKLLTGMIKE
jgi:RNA polymerase sigma-70 factor (ECF subfamily)